MTDTREDMDNENGEFVPSQQTINIGARLRAIRKQKRMSLQAVEATSNHEFRASVLGAYERGERSISVPRLQRLAELYAVPVDQLLPETSRTPTSSLPPSRGEAGLPQRIRIDLTVLKNATGREADALRHFLAQVQVQRQDFNGRVLTIRTEDLRVLGASFGRNVAEMVEALDVAGLVHHPGAD
jgi:transcriptional regulator with XRE-family HTH domain